MVTACFLCLPLVVKSVTPLIEAPYYIAAYQQALANHVTPSAPLMEALGTIKAAAAAAPGEWQQWYWICIGGVAVFIATIFVMRGRWSPAAAQADERHTTPPWHASCTPCKELKKVIEFQFYCSPNEVGQATRVHYLKRPSAEFVLQRSLALGFGHFLFDWSFQSPITIRLT